MQTELKIQLSKKSFSVNGLISVVKMAVEMSVLLRTTHTWIIRLHKPKPRCERIKYSSMAYELSMQYSVVLDLAAS